MWLQTEAGIDWSCDEPENREAQPVVTEDIVDWLTGEYVYSDAANCSNPRIRAFIERFEYAGLNDHPDPKTVPNFVPTTKLDDSRPIAIHLHRSDCWIEAYRVSSTFIEVAVSCCLFVRPIFGTRRSVVQIHSPRPIKTLSPKDLRCYIANVLCRICSARSAISVGLCFGGLRKLEAESNFGRPQLSELRVFRQLFPVPR